MTSRRYPLDPLLKACGLHRMPPSITGATIQGWRGQPAGIRALALILGISYRHAQRIGTTGLSDYQADRYAIRLGYHPSHIWPDWFDIELDLTDSACRADPSHFDAA